MERHMIRAGFIAGATAGVALGLLQWAAYLAGILPYQVYILTAGIVLPPTLAFTVYGYLLGFLGHTVFSGLLGILFAYILHHRFERALSWGAGFGVAVLILLAGFIMAWITPEQPFWNMTQPALYFTVVTRILYGVFIGYLYRQYMMLPARH